jgi:hypothetical protein
MPGRIFSQLFALVCFALAAWVGWYYPLPVWPLAVALVGYAAALWRWPALFLIAIPAALPTLDLGIWTGWTTLGEPDLVILISTGILLVRDPPSRTDVLPPRPVSTILVFLTMTFGISALIGLWTVTNEGPVSDNPYLRPDSALRLIKPLAEALLLLPFMRHRQRFHGDMAAWLGWGMVLGVTGVAIEVIAEREAFTGLFDFTTDYRVTAAFYSMNIGGGHIGAYIAMATPFLLGCALATRRWYASFVLFALTFTTAYALVVTFARTSYAAGVIALLLTAAAWLALRPRDARGSSGWLIAMLLIVPVPGGVVLAASSGYMRERLAQSATDLLTREANWRHGWALHDGDPLHLAFGMGLGTYPRLNQEEAAGDKPGDFRLVGSGENRYLTLISVSPLYIGQKLFFRPSGPLRLRFRWRASAASDTADVFLCEKILLYSDNCRGQNVPSHAPGTWEAVSIAISTDGLGAKRFLGFPVRQMEFTLAGAPGTTIAFSGLSLIDAQGREILLNGNFADGMARWGFSNDDHLVWRMKNLYLMLLFETGFFGLLGFAVLCAGAVAGGTRAIRNKEPMGAAVIGSVGSFLISGLFDHMLEAPRIATVFLLVCMTGLISLARKEQPRDRDKRPEPLVAEIAPARIGTPIGEIERY